MEFPNQQIPDIEKTPEWCSLHGDYAQAILRSSNADREKMNSDFMSWNGVKAPNSMDYLTKTYGKDNLAKYISYRVHAPKIKLRLGEFLASPLAATVETTNRDAKSEKMAQADLYLGAMAAKAELMHLKEKVGVDVMEGAPIPDSEEDPLWEKMSPKDKNEDIMQIILDEQIIDDDIKIKLSQDNLNGHITSFCFSKVERNEQGETKFISYDPREAIFEQVKGDIFLERSPILGAAPYKPLHEILKRYKFNTKQLALLKNIGATPMEYYKSSNGGMRMNNGTLFVQEMHIEWKSVSPVYFKKMPKTATQMQFSETDYIIKELDTKDYESKKEWHDQQVAKGKYEIIVKYKEVLWEMTRIGGLRELDVECRPSLFQMRSVDDPSRITASSYTGFLCQTVDGIRISLMNELENLSNQFDIVMYKINSDIIRSKGKALGFNLAALHKNSTAEKTLAELFNAGIIFYDTSASGNMHGRDVSLNNMITEADLGLSSSFPALVNQASVILDMMNNVTGINENRSGQIQASETAANNSSAIQSSRTITAAFDYGFNLYIKKVLTKVVESAKITWAFFKIEKAEQILGAGKWKYLQVTQELGYRDYGVHIQDGGKYAQVRQFMQGLMEASLNAKEMRPEDALKFMLSETFAEQKAVLENSWAKIKELEGQAQQANIQNQQQMQQAQLATQIEIANADREDRQLNEKDNIILQGDTDIRVNQSKMSDQVIVNQHKIESENLNNELI